MINLYLLFGAVEAGFLNLWIIGYAVILLLWGQRREAAVVAHAVRWCTGRRLRVDYRLPAGRDAALGAHPN